MLATSKESLQPPRYLPLSYDWNDPKLSDGMRLSLISMYSKNELEQVAEEKLKQKELDEKNAPIIKDSILNVLKIENEYDRVKAFRNLRMSKPELVQYCRFYGIVQKGDTDEILSRIRRHLEGTLEEKEMRKKPKLIDPTIQETDLMELYKSNKLETAPVDALKLFCSKHFLHKNGTKKTLFARVRRYLLEHDETREVITPAEAWKKFKESFPRKKRYFGYSTDDEDEDDFETSEKETQI